MRIPLLNLARQLAPLQQPILSAVREVLEQGQFILGPKVRELEQLLAQKTGARYAVGVASGTDALQLALRALGIQASDGVITSAYSFIASAGAISLVGAVPYFIDIEPETCNLDPQCLSRFLEQECRVSKNGPVHRRTRHRIRAILPVHLFGQCADMNALMAIAERYGLPVVEDAAQSLGAQVRIRRRWRTAGTMGTLGCYSFFPTKNLGGLGDGGMVVTSAPELNERLRCLRTHGTTARHHHQLIGTNSRLDELQAAILLVRLQSLAELNQRRQANAEYYNRHLAEFLKVPQVRNGNRHIFNQYVVRTTERDALAAFLAAHGIASEIYYPRPLPLQPCYRHLGYRAGDFPVAEQASRETLALPIDPMLTGEEREYIVTTIRAYFTGAK